MVYVGVDLHKRYSVMTAQNEAGELLAQSRIANRQEKIISFLTSLDSEKPDVVVEATANWYWFEKLLREHDIPLKLAHPLKTKAIASARIKTDKIDSNILAHLLRSDLLPEAYIPDDETRSRRELLRNRAFLVRLRTAIKCRIHATIAKLNLESQLSDLFGKSGRQFLETVSVPPTQREALESYLRMLDRLEEEIEEFSQRIKKTVRDDERARRLMDIPGVGYHLSLLILSEIGDVNRFPSAKNLVSYAGLCPSTHSSGGKTFHGKITKQGSKYLRWALVEAATKAAMVQPEIKAFYLRLKPTKGANRARVAVARKLLENIYHMLKKNETFEESVKRWRRARHDSGL